MKAITTALSALSIATCSPTPATTSFGSGEPPTSAGAAETTAAASTTANAESTSTGSTSSSAGSTGTSSGAIPDLGTMPDLGSPLPAGCEGKKIDFLFVISNANTMEFAQERLLAAFPGFMDAIEAKKIDKHILVTTSLPLWHMSDCSDCISDCDKNGSPTQCGAELTECDSMLGAAYTFPAGKGATNRRCTLAGGTPYITSKEVNVDAAFKCLATVGLDGSNYYDADAVRAAISPAMNATGACNEGFLRDDALLVVTLISNTYDYGPKPGGSSGSPEDWAAAVLDAKHGDPESIVMLSILRAFAVCEVEDRTCQMVKMFPYHLLFDRDMPNYGPAFDQATDMVEDACAGFKPPA